MQVYPLAFIDSDMIAAGAVYLVANLFGMVGRDPGLPAVQEFSLADLLVSEEPPAAGGAVDGYHCCGEISYPGLKVIGPLKNKPYGS